MQQTDTNKINDVVKQLVQLFPNFNFVFLMWENGSSAVNLISNLPDSAARQALMDVGSQLHISEQVNRAQFKGLPHKPNPRT